MISVERLVGLIFTCIGLILFTVGLVVYINTLNSLQGTIASHGRIVSCRMQRSVSSDKSVSYLCQPTVRFRTTAGQQVDFVSSVSSSTFHGDEDVSVQYHPSHPRDALISSFMDLWFVPLLLGGMGLIFTVVGLLLLVGPLLLRLRTGSQASGVVYDTGGMDTFGSADSFDWMSTSGDTDNSGWSSGEVQASNEVDSGGGMSTSGDASSSDWSSSRE